MLKYVSTKGGITPVGFDEAVLQGFAEDGGLFVPESIPQISEEQLLSWSTLSYTELAFEMLCLFIDQETIPPEDLKKLISESFASFKHPELMPLVPDKKNGNFFIMELFHGPTLSFKDIAMGFLIRTMDYFLQKRGQHLNLVLATTGDTGPAAAYAAAGRKTIDCWPLYPSGMISDEQERQMTTLTNKNIHPIAVEDCPDGGDDLDLVVAKMFASKKQKEKLKLSSVNSINWCRVMVQAVHYAYGYFRACKKVGEPVIFSVPSGAFGNLCAGYLAREMGIPVKTFICANNQNKTLHTTFSTGTFKKQDLIQTVSSAIDIVVPYNFWRFLYFNTQGNSELIATLMNSFQQKGQIVLDPEIHKAIRQGFESISVSDALTLSTIKEHFDNQQYLLDPHGAVAVAAAKSLRTRRDENIPVVVLATAHPAKFPEITRMALHCGKILPDNGLHSNLERAKSFPEKKLFTNRTNLESFLSRNIESNLKSKI